MLTVVAEECRGMEHRCAIGVSGWCGAIGGVTPLITPIAIVGFSGGDPPERMAHLVEGLEGVGAMGNLASSGQTDGSLGTE